LPVNPPEQELEVITGNHNEWKKHFPAGQQQFEAVVAPVVLLFTHSNYFPIAAKEYFYLTFSF
jgi:hypothetical protein